MYLNGVSLYNAIQQVFCRLSQKHRSYYRAVWHYVRTKERYCEKMVQAVSQHTTNWGRLVF